MKKRTMSLLLQKVLAQIKEKDRSIDELVKINKTTLSKVKYSIVSLRHTFGYVQIKTNFRVKGCKGTYHWMISRDPIQQHMDLINYRVKKELTQVKISKRTTEKEIQLTGNNPKILALAQKNQMKKTKMIFLEAPEED